MNSIKKVLYFLIFILLTFSLWAQFNDNDEPLIELEPEVIPQEEEELVIDEPDLSDEINLASSDLLYDDDYYYDDDSLFYEASPLVFEVSPFIGLRSIDDIFPRLSRSQRVMAGSETGLRYSYDKITSSMLRINPDSGVELLSAVAAKNPSHVVEALALVPYNDIRLDLLDIYNALGEVQNIKDHSISLNGRDIHIFTETTRLESARNRRPISDPLPADTLPYSDTMYVRFTDAYFGDVYIRADVSFSLYGVTYNMTNFRDVRYALLPLMRAERVSIIIYLEPVKEGILIYSLTGFYLPGLISNSVNLTPSINRRITVLLNWITEGLRKQELVIN